jgi:uncharacterized protein (DUF302 family)
MSKQELGMTVQVHTDMATAQERVTAALKTEGFGVLTEIDVKATFKQKLNVDFRPYKILGACNPTLANRALTITPDAGLLLPCNVTLSEVAEGVIEVSIVNPERMLEVLEIPELEEISCDAHDRLARVIAALKE